MDKGSRLGGGEGARDAEPEGFDSTSNLGFVSGDEAAAEGADDESVARSATAPSSPQRQPGEIPLQWRSTDS